MSVVGALASIHCGGGLVVALVLVVINAEGVKKEKEKEKVTCWARWRQYTEAGEWSPPMLGGEWGCH